MPDAQKIDINSTEYPLLLREIPDPPKYLYYKGIWDPDVFAECISVVGSRKMTMYGRQVISKLLSELSGFNITIVSGFMYGVDIAAHEKALALNMPTIAVLPFGIEFSCDRSLSTLYSRILDHNGLIISEWGDTLAPRKWTFYKRNRLVAGLSKLTLVIEAGLASGSLITANFAKAYNRVVVAVPGSIFNPLTEGTAHLISLGAGVVTSGYAISKIMHFDTLTCSKQRKVASHVKINAADKLVFVILSAIKSSPLSIDELCTELNLPIDVLSTNLTLLSLSGSIIEDNGKYYLPCS